MDRDVWQSVVGRVALADRRVRRTPGPERRPRVRSADRVVVLMYCRAVGHDRPLCRACDRAHYGSPSRPRKLPGVSQFCKRVKDDDERVRLTPQALHELTCDAGRRRAWSAASTASCCRSRCTAATPTRGRSGPTPATSAATGRTRGATAARSRSGA